MKRELHVVLSHEEMAERECHLETACGRTQVGSKE